MTRKISLDFETRSPGVDLLDCGSYKYAANPPASVLVLAVKQWPLNDGKPVLSWDITRPIRSNDALDLLWCAIEFGWEIHAFQSQFEWCFLKYVCPRQFGLPVPDINRMRCTQALCRSSGLQNSLAKCAKELKVDFQKDAMGTSLMRKFSIPDKEGNFTDPDDDVSFTAGGVRMTASEGFARYVQYCESDVRAEMAVAHAMRGFELKGFALDSFLATARLNDRGVPVDRNALENAHGRYREHEERLTREYVGITGLNPTQTGKSLAWFREQGYPSNTLKKEVRGVYLDDERLSKEARRALSIKGELSFAAVKKIPAMLNWVMGDGKVRGSFVWAGAQKTWRWTSDGCQWQNMKKPGKRLRPRVEEAYQDVAKGRDLELLSICYGDPYELIASLARYFVRFPDCDIFDLDYSSVEAVILPFLIGYEERLEKFRRGDDPYVAEAEALSAHLKGKFDVPFEITRNMAKTCVLATQFGGGWNAVFTAMGHTWEREWCEVTAAIIRKNNPEFVKAWRVFQDTFVKAMEEPGVWHQATGHVSFGYRDGKPFPHMLMRLPSGRPIVMPYPEKNPITMVKVVKINRKTGKEKSQWERVNGHEEDPDVLEHILCLGEPFRPNERVSSHFQSWELSYWGHTENSQYGRVNTYGGSLLQGATQGTGADLLAMGLMEAERQGFDPFFIVHDQCLAPARGDRDAFVRALCKVPDWFEGFPLAADAKTVRSYCKS